jgi:hypothetical protein
MQPRVNRLAAEHHVVITLQRIRKLPVPRLNQHRALILLAPVQQFEVESPVGPMRSGKRPRPPVTGLRLVEPAICRLLLVPGGPATGRHCSKVRSARARAGPPSLLAAATAGRAATASRTRRAIVPALAGRVMRRTKALTSVRAAPAVTYCEDLPVRYPPYLYRPTLQVVQRWLIRRGLPWFGRALICSLPPVAAVCCERAGGSRTGREPGRRSRRLEGVLDAAARERIIARRAGAGRAWTGGVCRWGACLSALG